MIRGTLIFSGLEFESEIMLDPLFPLANYKIKDNISRSIAIGHKNELRG
jgi:hypothetical protein